MAEIGEWYLFVAGPFELLTYIICCMRVCTAHRGLSAAHDGDIDYRLSLGVKMCATSHLIPPN